MSNRELAAYLIASMMVLGVLIAWRMAASRKRRDRRSGYSQIDLVGGGRALGGASVDDNAQGCRERMRARGSREDVQATDIG